MAFVSTHAEYHRSYTSDSRGLATQTDALSALFHICWQGISDRDAAAGPRLLPADSRRAAV